MTTPTDDVLKNADDVIAELDAVIADVKGKVEASQAKAAAMATDNEALQTKIDEEIRDEVDALQSAGIDLVNGAEE